MSWLSSIIKGVSKAVGSVGTAIDKDIIKPLVPDVITGLGVAAIGSVTGGAAFGSASILGDIFGAAKQNGQVVPVGSGSTPLAMGLTGDPNVLGSDGSQGYLSGAIANFDAQVTSQVTNQVEGFLGAASHNIEAQGIRLGIYAVLILFMLGAFVALLLPDEQQSVNILDKAGDLAPVGA